jgi:hypothetical protein
LIRSTALGETTALGLDLAFVGNTVSFQIIEGRPFSTSTQFSQSQSLAACRTF